MVASGSVTASVHSFSAAQSGATNFFYFNDALGTIYPDSDGPELPARHIFPHNNGIPLSQLVIAHYSEIGTTPSRFDQLGVQYFLLEVPPGTIEYPHDGESGPPAPWIVGGPYRLYETPQQGQVDMPMFYADWLTVPGHPQLNGKFFNCYTEI